MTEGLYLWVVSIMDRAPKKENVEMIFLKVPNELSGMSITFKETQLGKEKYIILCLNLEGSALHLVPCLAQWHRTRFAKDSNRTRRHGTKGLWWGGSSYINSIFITFSFFEWNVSSFCTMAASNQGLSYLHMYLSSVLKEEILHA